MLESTFNSLYIVQEAIPVAILMDLYASMRKIVIWSLRGGVVGNPGGIGNKHAAMITTVIRATVITTLLHAAVESAVRP